MIFNSRTFKISSLAAALSLTLGCQSGNFDTGGSNPTIANSTSVPVAPAPTSPADPSLTPLKVGNWGVKDVSGNAMNNFVGMNFVVSDQQAVLNTGCGTSQISQPILVDANGEFDVVGSVSQRGGTLPVGGFLSRPAHFHGAVSGDTLSLTTTVDEDGSMTTVELTFGVVNHLIFCP